VGKSVGREIGTRVGADVGRGVGAEVGSSVGVEKGVEVGSLVSENVGPIEGFSVSRITVSKPSTVWGEMYAFAAAFSSNRRPADVAATASRSAVQLPELTFRVNKAWMSS
jgi:hypothetical protein